MLGTVHLYARVSLTYILSHTHSHTHTHIHTLTHTLTYTLSHTHSHTHSHIHTLTYTLTYTHSNIRYGAPDQPVWENKWTSIVGKTVTGDMADPKWHYRLPFFAEVSNNGTKDVSVIADGNSTAVMEQEIKYAVDYGEWAPSAAIDPESIHLLDLHSTNSSYTYWIYIQRIHHTPLDLHSTNPSYTYWIYIQRIHHTPTGSTFAESIVHSLTHVPATFYTHVPATFYTHVPATFYTHVPATFYTWNLTTRPLFLELLPVPDRVQGELTAPSTVIDLELHFTDLYLLLSALGTQPTTTTRTTTPPKPTVPRSNAVLPTTSCPTPSNATLSLRTATCSTSR
jgi:hypothetical protein